MLKTVFQFLKCTDKLSLLKFDFFSSQKSSCYLAALHRNKNGNTELQTHTALLA